MAEYSGYAPPLSAPAVQIIGDVSARPRALPVGVPKLLYDRSTDVVISTAPASNARVLDPDSFVLNEILMATIGLKISYVPFP
ncbi:hypothetical protein EVAR_95045_1 [Eumeta japonica]|uniref:Uncharacterized protein n=1 Tax=Eumeta variegata TaxID=151549 RepID=A0A4C1SMF3_EUMVA|nr:hypothetical protein EVAR_95045_1 [Eumeta japonica]